MSSSQPNKQYTCLNNPIEFWTVFKIPKAILTTPPKPQPSQHGDPSGLLHLPIELLLSIFQAVAAHNPDPLDQLALSLTCKPLLAVAAASSTSKASASWPDGRKGLTVPSITHHAPLEPPCPAILRLQSILTGFPSPPSLVGPHTFYTSRAQLLDLRHRLVRRRGFRYYFGTYLHTDLSPIPGRFSASSRTRNIDSNRHDHDAETHPNNLEYCPSCCHPRPLSTRFWGAASPKNPTSAPC